MPIQGFCSGNFPSLTPASYFFYQMSYYHSLKKKKFSLWELHTICLDNIDPFHVVFLDPCPLPSPSSCMFFYVFTVIWSNLYCSCTPECGPFQRAAILILWVVTPLEGPYQITCILDIYIAINNSRKFAVLKKQWNNFMVEIITWRTVLKVRSVKVEKQCPRVWATNQRPHLEAMWPSVSRQLSTALTQWYMWDSIVISPFHVGIRSGWGCTGLVHAVTVTKSSYVQMPGYIQKMLFSCGPWPLALTFFLPSLLQRSPRLGSKQV